MTVPEKALTRSAFAVPAEIASEIWKKTLSNSLAMQLATRIELPADGKEFPIYTGDIEPDWVAEGEEKPVATASFSSKTLKPYKMAVIVPFSDEFRRDRNAFYNCVIEQIPLYLARKFDKAVFNHDATAVPGEQFDNFAEIADIDLKADKSTVYKQLVAADAAINTAGYIANGYAITPQMRGLLLAETDGIGRPLFNPAVTADGYAQILGNPAIMSLSNGANKENLYSEYTDDDKTIKTLGIVGDWTQAVYGTVEGIKLDISDSATLNDGDNVINLWQRNMFAVRAEVEIGFGIKDEDAFKRLVTIETA